MKTIYIKECNSTNDFISEIIENNFSDFSAVYTFNQTKGKGQNGNSWEMEINKNLAISFIINSLIFDIEPLFISFFVTCKSRYFIEKYTNLNIEIKWPNDLICNNKKIAGILIEQKYINNKIIVAGIGVNINQTDFKNLKKASSLKLFSNVEYDLHDFAIEYQRFLKQEFQKIEFKNIIDYYNNLIIEYNNFLFKKNEKSNFKINDSLYNGEIQQVDNQGNLHVIINKQIKLFRNKQIELIY